MEAGLLAWRRDVDRLEIHGSEVIRWDVFLKANYGKLHWVKGDFFCPDFSWDRVEFFLHSAWHGAAFWLWADNAPMFGCC